MTEPSPSPNTPSFRGSAVWLVGLSVVLTVWAVVLFVRPSDSTHVLARLLGVGFVLLGASLLSTAFARDARVPDRVGGWAWLLVGAAGLVWPDPTMRGLALLAGTSLVVIGFTEAATALRTTDDGRLILAISAFTSLGFGVAALAWPTATTLVLSVVMGVRLLVAAARLLGSALDRGGGQRTAHPRWRWHGRLFVNVAGLVVALLVGTAAVVVNRAQPGEPGAFYDSPGASARPPGTLVRSEVIDDYLDGATTYRVLYETSDADGSPTTASGLVFVPDVPPPGTGRPVVAFTHGTIGIARRCAPSLLPGDAYAPAIAGLAGFLAAGFVVTATDYAGLGSDATTGYLVGTSEAYSTLDSVRAAMALPDAEASPRFITFGESQGGHAALFAAELAESYAPDLELVGVAAAAPATDLVSLFQQNLGTTFGDVLAAFALRSWHDVYGADLSDVVDDQATPVIDRLAGFCLQDEAQMLAVVPEAELLKIRFLDARPWDVEPWASIIADNTPGARRVDAPVLIGQGAADPLVLPDVQQRFVNDWCGRGQPIEYRTYDGVGHLDAGHAMADDAVAWATARFAGDDWTPTCPTDT